MSNFWIKLVDIDSNDLGLITQFQNLEVDIPWLDSRTGNVSISMEDPLANEIRPLNRLLEVYYGDYYHPVLTGHILQPRFNFAAGTIDMGLHDSTIKLKHHYHRFGDVVVDKGYPVDGRGLRRLVESSVPWESQIAAGVKPNGILWGQNLTNNQPSADDDGIWGRCIRGENVWDSILKLAQKNIGPDFDFEPRRDLDPGFFVRMHVGAKYDDPGGGDPYSLDLSDTVKFIYGINCDDFTYEPDGNAVRNYYVAVNPGGEKNRATAYDNKGLFHDAASWYEYGIMQGWESVAEEISKELLEADAEHWVKAYAWPPEFFTVSPKQDSPNVPKYMRDFKVGDFVTASGLRAGIERTVSGRVLRARLTQPNPNTKQSRLQLECAPLIGTGQLAGEGET